MRHLLWIALATFAAASGAYATTTGSRNDRAQIEAKLRATIDAHRDLKRKAYPLFIFIPGILGSKIEECARSGKCNPIWGVDGAASADMSIKSEVIVKTEPLASLSVSAFSVDVYGEALKYVADQYWGDEPSLLTFSYDWRNDNRLSAKSLHLFLCDRADIVKGRPLVFLAHSMGGIVLKHWYARFYQERQGCSDARPEALDLAIAELLFAGTPHFGAAKALHAFGEGPRVMTDGDGFFAGLTGRLERALFGPLHTYGAEFPSVYQLLPVYSEPECQHAKALEQLPPAAFNDSGGKIDLFSMPAWRQIGWPRHLRSALDRDAFYTSTLRDVLHEAKVLACSTSGLNYEGNIRRTYIFGTGFPTPATYKVIPPDWSTRLRFPPQEPSVLRLERSEKGDKTVLAMIAKNPLERHYGNVARRGTTASHHELMKSAEMLEHVQEIYQAADADVSERLLQLLGPERLKPFLRLNDAGGRPIVSAQYLTAPPANRGSASPELRAFNSTLLREADQTALGLFHLGIRDADQERGARLVSVAVSLASREELRQYASITLDAIEDHVRRNELESARSLASRSSAWFSDPELSLQRWDLPSMDVADLFSLLHTVLAAYSRDQKSHIDWNEVARFGLFGNEKLSSDMPLARLAEQCGKGCEFQIGGVIAVTLTSESIFLRPA